MMPVRILEACRSGCYWCLTLGLLLVSVPVGAAVLDPDSEANPFLDHLAPALDELGVDVARNLNERGIVRGRPARVRLGAFPDLPPGQMPDSPDLLSWESLVAAGSVGGMAILPSAAADESSQPFAAAWAASPATQRRFVVYHRDDQGVADQVEAALTASGYRVQGFAPGSDAEQAGRVYVLAGSRLALDSIAARRLGEGPREFQFLGERPARGELRILADNGRVPAERREPAVFRKSSLGDEHTASTIEEIIVPGGIALGETATLDFTAAELRYRNDQLQLADEEGRWYGVPFTGQPGVLKALFDFTQRGALLDSDAVVDIDADGRVRMSSALRDTDVGHRLMEIDVVPFSFIRNLPVTKSVIVDVSVAFQGEPATGELRHTTVYEVRFLSADTLRIAQTRAALEYRYTAATDAVEYRYAWGRDTPRLDENLDYAGLGEQTADVARYAAVVALMRHLDATAVPFVEGRYEFMKIDTQGRRTPNRF